MQSTWRNWSGSLKFQPAGIFCPDSEEEMLALVREALTCKKLIRVVGSGHSSSPLVSTPDWLVSLERLNQIHAHEAQRNEVVIGPGASLEEAGQMLLARRLGFENLGDIDQQKLAGAFATGTHGSGGSIRNLSSHLVGVRYIDGAGLLHEKSDETDYDFMSAARVSLGVLGVFTRLQLRLLPAYRLRRREWCAGIEDCLAHLDTLIAGNRNFDFYWYPRNDLAKLRTLNPESEPVLSLPFARCIAEDVGWGHEIISRRRELRFDEMEYAVPRAAGSDCFREVRHRIKTRHRHYVGWRVLYRTIAADDFYLSPAFGYDVATISLHQNAGLPYSDFFQDIEPIFHAYGGRPHWGKKHNLRARDLSRLYPCWESFQRIRRQVDPGECFLNPYLRELLNED